MELVIPDGSRVTIAIGSEPAALPETFAPERPPAGSRHRLLKGAVVGMLVLGAFVAGQRFGGHGGPQLALADPSQPSSTVLPLPTLGQAQHAFPAAPLPRPAPPPAAPQVPPQFARRMRQPPVVVPPPGQTPTRAAARKNPFGLDN